MFKKTKLIISIFILIVVASTGTRVFALFSAGTLVSMTNNQRAQNGLKSLSTNQALGNAALAKVNDMFAKGYFAHTSPDGKTPWDFIHQAGYNYSYAGENLAIGYNDASELMNAWMNSPTHRENILSQNFTEIGVAAISGNYNGSETIIVAQEFGASPASSVQSAQSTSPPAEATPATTAQPSFNLVQEKSGVNPKSLFAGEQVDFTVTVTGEVKTLELTVGSIKMNVLETENVVVLGNQKTYTLTKKIDSSGTYDITVVATDSSGNEKTLSLEQLEVKPTVIAKDLNSSGTQSKFAGFESTASMVGMIIFGGVLISSIVYLIIRRNKLRNIVKTTLATWEF